MRQQQQKQLLQPKPPVSSKSGWANLLGRQTY
jgi:hypothetical protein